MEACQRLSLFETLDSMNFQNKMGILIKHPSGSLVRQTVTQSTVRVSGVNKSSFPFQKKPQSIIDINCLLYRVGVKSLRGRVYAHISKYKSSSD